MSRAKQPDFDKSMDRLQEIVSRMGAKELSLDESLGLFEEGVRLVEQCSKTLDEAQLKVEKLEAVCSGGGETGESV